MTQITIANTELDFKTIAGLAEIIWKEHYTPIIGIPQVDYMLDKYQSVKAIKNQVSEGAAYYILKSKEQALGYLSISRKEDSLFLSKLYVLSSLRGKGIGKTAMQFIESETIRLGYTKISLTVNKYNKASIKAYEKMGFEKIKEVVFDIGMAILWTITLWKKH